MPLAGGVRGPHAGRARAGSHSQCPHAVTRLPYGPELTRNVPSRQTPAHLCRCPVGDLRRSVMR